MYENFARLLYPRVGVKSDGLLFFEKWSKKTKFSKRRSFFEISLKKTVKFLRKDIFSWGGGGQVC